MAASNFMPMRIAACLACIIFIATVAYITFLSDATGAELQFKDVTARFRESSQLNVTIVEGNGWHGEVFTALGPLFGSITTKATINLYVRSERYGLRPVLTGAARELERELNISPFSDWNASREQADILVLTTCEMDLLSTRVGAQLRDLNDYTQIFCVLHNSNIDMRVHDHLLRPFLLQGRLSFLGLSRHTTAWLRQQLIDFSGDYAGARFEHFIPIFELGHEPEPEPCLFAIQGKFEDDRRDFVGALHRLSQLYEYHKQALDAVCDIQINLVGAGPQRYPIPDNLSGRVHYHENLPYTEYYQLLGRSQALLPAFASDIYLEEKASSSIPAALIAGVPLAVSHDMVDRYDYLDRAAMYYAQKPTQDISSVITSVLVAGKDGIRSEIVGKRQAVKRNREAILASNRRMITRLVSQVCPDVFV